MNKDELRSIAKQLNKPHGSKGLEVAELMNDGNLPMNLHSLAVLNPSAHDSILEIGMGNGLFIKNIVNIDPTIRYTGCDFSSLMVKESIRRNQSFIENGQVKIIEGSLDNLPFNEQSFNKIITINTLYFWDDIEQSFSELKRVLQVNGQLIISIRPKHNLKLFPVTQFGFSMFTKENLYRLFVLHGFKNIEITEIKEPPQKRWEKTFERETLIVSGKLI